MRASIALITIACFLPFSVGCVSHEYVIPKKELARLAGLPSAERGARVHVVQELGERRADAVSTEHVGDVYAVETAPTDDSLSDVDVGLRVDGNVQAGGRYGQGGGRSPNSSGRWGGPPARAAEGSWRGAPPAPAAGSWRGAPPSGGGSGGVAWRGTPSTGGGGGSWRGVPSSGGSSSGGGGKGSSGGGGGNLGEAAVVLIVVLAVIAVVAAVGLVASEGARFDGFAEMWPGQPVHLQQENGTTRVVALADLSPADLGYTVEAKVMDDEGYGIRPIETVLTRRGGAFKLNGGVTAFRRGDNTASGMSGDFAVGGFFSPSFGILVGATLGGAEDGLGDVLTRHGFFLELQSLPVAAGKRLHLGGYANGGVAIARTTAPDGGAESGPVFGGGALLELDLNGRLALALRAGANAARFETGWSPAATATIGLSIY